MVNESKASRVGKDKQILDAIIQAYDSGNMISCVEDLMTEHRRYYSVLQSVNRLKASGELKVLQLHGIKGKFIGQQYIPLAHLNELQYKGKVLI